jgi:hypothetical protein
MFPSRVEHSPCHPKVMGGENSSRGGAFKICYRILTYISEQTFIGQILLKNFLLLQFTNISKDVTNFEVVTSEKFNLIVCEFKLKHA